MKLEITVDSMMTEDEQARFILAQKILAQRFCDDIGAPIGVRRIATRDEVDFKNAWDRIEFKLSFLDFKEPERKKLDEN